MESPKTSSSDITSPMLIIFGGLPATGKTTIAVRPSAAFSGKIR